MRKIFYLFLAVLILQGYCFPVIQGNNLAEVDRNPVSIDPANLLTASDAEKILGEPAHLTDSVTTIKDDVTEFRSAYTANSLDKKTEKTGAVYFLFEQYPDLTSAEKKYSFIKRSNEDHEGVKVLNDLGDEAYFHTDEENFYFIMIRKGERIITMKVNKITSKTSLEEFNLIAKKITDVMSNE